MALSICFPFQPAAVTRVVLKLAGTVDKAFIKIAGVLSCLYDSVILHFYMFCIKVGTFTFLAYVFECCVLIGR